MEFSYARYGNIINIINLNIFITLLEYSRNSMSVVKPHKNAVAFYGILAAKYVNLFYQNQQIGSG